jgi:outer membrane protein OmpA-like peptidoglycan-associated protein
LVQNSGIGQIEHDVWLPQFRITRRRKSGIHFKTPAHLRELSQVTVQIYLNLHGIEKRHLSLSLANCALCGLKHRLEVRDMLKKQIAIPAIVAPILVIFLVCAAHVARAGVQELPVSADRCSIFFALTGRVQTGCADPGDLDLGAKRRLQTKQEFSKAALPPKDLETEKGYFVHFAFNSDALTQAYHDHLDRLGAILRDPALENSCIKLVGHTDSVGGAAFNLRLSDARASQVAAYLVAKGKVPAKMVLTEAKGEAGLLPGIPGPHPRNRRVEVLAKPRIGNTCQ